MKLNKSKNKGKVHPSPSLTSSSSSISSNKYNEQILSHLLPTAILTLISVLSLQDREALAYLITHSLNSSSFDHKFTPKKPHKKSSSSSSSNTSSGSNHKSPSFDCCCFDCFSSFWNRWDSSPHRELIDQAIEAFEEHLALTENRKPKSKNGASKRREKTHKMGCSATADVEERDLSSSGPHNQPEEVPAVVGADVEERESAPPEVPVCADVEGRESEEWLTVSAEVVTGVEEGDEVEEERESGTHKKLLQQQLQKQQQQQHKGLARKVLPDVIGLFNSRLWNLWGPNV